MPKKIVNFEGEEVSGVDHPATMLEGWIVRKSKDLDLNDEDLTKLREILTEAERIAQHHDGLVKDLTGSPLLEAAPEDIRSAASTVAQYLTELGTASKSTAKAGKKVSASRLNRLKEIHRVLDELVKEVEPADLIEGDAETETQKSNDKEGRMSDKTFDRDALDDVAKAAFDAVEAELATTKAALEAAEAASVEATTKVEELSKKIEEIESAAAEKDAAEKAAADAKAAEDEVLKSLPESVRKMLDEREEMIKSMSTRLEAAEKVAKEERDARLNKAFVEKAAAWEGLSVNAEEFGPLFRELSDRSPELAAEVERILNGATEAVKQAGAFDEIGKSTDSDKGASAMDKLESLAKSIADEQSIDFSTAYLKALDTETGKKLYADYLNERMGV